MKRGNRTRLSGRRPSTQHARPAATRRQRGVLAMAADDTSTRRVRRLEDDMSAAWKFLAGSHRLQFVLDARTERIDGNLADLTEDMRRLAADVGALRNKIEGVESAVDQGFQTIQTQLEALRGLIAGNGA